MASQELSLGIVEARRKGRSQKPCQIGIALADEQKQIVVRTEDHSGKPPIVMVLSPTQASNLIGLLQQAVDAKRIA